MKSNWDSTAKDKDKQLAENTEKIEELEEQFTEKLETLGKEFSTYKEY